MSRRPHSSRIARVANFSPYHFHLVYVAVIGETVADTMRRNRLNRAAIRLLATATPVARLAREAGMESVFNRCVKIEHARLFGGLNWMGVNTGVISARRPRWLAN